MADSEAIGIAEVLDQISKTDCLRANLNTFDKIPSWDGEVYIYTKPNSTDKSGIKIVRVQVKTHRRSVKKFQRQIKYSISKTDIENYKNNGGVIFFVVYYRFINKVKIEKKIYCIPIFPAKALFLLNKYTGKESIKLHLNEFPSDPDMIKYLFMNFYEDCQRQVSCVSTNNIAIQTSNIKNIKFYTHINNNSSDLLKSIFSSEHQLYVINGCSMPVPLKNSITVKEIKISPTAVVRIKNDCYYNNIDVKYKNDNAEVSFGDCFTIQIPQVYGNESNIFNFKYNIPSKARSRYYSLLFLKLLISEKYFYIDDIRYNINEDFIAKADLLKQFNEIERLSPIIQLLSIFNCKQDLDLSQLSQSDWNHLEILISSIVQNNPQKIVIKDDNNAEVNVNPVLTTFKVGNLNFFIIIHFDGHVHNIINPFTINCYVNAAGKKFTILSLLNKDDYLSLSNIPIETIGDFYKDINGDCDLFSEMLNTIDKLIFAYYCSHCRFELLDAANKLLLFASNQKHGDSFDTSIQIFKLQLSLLNHSFSETDQIKIEEMLDSYQEHPEILFCLYLLKNDQRHAFRMYSRLSQENKELIENRSIYSLYDYSSADV